MTTQQTFDEAFFVNEGPLGLPRVKAVKYQEDGQGGVYPVEVSPFPEGTFGGKEPTGKYASGAKSFLDDFIKNSESVFEPGPISENSIFVPDEPGYGPVIPREKFLEVLEDLYPGSRRRIKNAVPNLMKRASQLRGV